MQEVIAKLNAQKPQTSQVSKIQPQPVVRPQPVVDEINMEDEEDAEDPEFYEDVEKKVEQKPVKQETTQQMPNVEMEMELLNNNGRFRAELLFQLQELNKALSVIAQVLMRK